MSDPMRWRKDDVPDEIRRMLEAGRPTRAMPSEVRKRLSRRLGVALASGTGLYLLSWKSLALAVTLGAAGVTTALVAEHVPQRPAREEPEAPRSARRGAPRATPVRDPQVRELNHVEAPELGERAVDAGDVRSAPTPHPAEPVAPKRPVASVRAERAPTRSTHAFREGAPVAAVHAPAMLHAPQDMLAQEIALLARARAQLEHNPDAALRTLEEHARTFASGQLMIERELLALDVLERLGQRPEARARAERLLSRARGTIYEERIRAWVERP